MNEKFMNEVKGRFWSLFESRRFVGVYSKFDLTIIRFKSDMIIVPPSKKISEARHYSDVDGNLRYDKERFFLVEDFIGIVLSSNNDKTKRVVFYKYRENVFSRVIYSNDGRLDVLVVNGFSVPVIVGVGKFHIFWKGRFIDVEWDYNEFCYLIRSIVEDNHNKKLILENIYGARAEIMSGNNVAHLNWSY